MDEEWHVRVDSVHPHLLESGSEFTVVACIGAQGAGKSTVLSLLLASFRGLLGGHGPGSQPGATGVGGSEEGGDGVGATRRGASEPAMAGAGNSQDEDTFEAPLGIHSAQACLEGRASPAGVDLCVSALDRLLLLDAQPLFGCNEGSPDTDLQSELYLLLFLTSICHTLVVVTDSAMDMYLWRTLGLLAALRAKVPDLASWVERQPEGSTSGSSEQRQTEQALPRLVVVFNNLPGTRQGAELFQPVRTLLEHSPWKASGSLQHLEVPTLPGSSISAMLTSNAAYSAGMRLRERVLCAGAERGRFGKDNQQFTEREWLYHVNGYWDFVQRAPAVPDYFSMLSKGLEQYGWPKL